MHIDKKPLPLDKYEQYGISQSYHAFVITILNATQEEVDQFEQDLILKHQKLFHAQMTRVHENYFHAQLIIATSSVLSDLKN